MTPRLWPPSDPPSNQELAYLAERLGASADPTDVGVAILVREIRRLRAQVSQLRLKLELGEPAPSATARESVAVGSALSVFWPSLVPVLAVLKLAGLTSLPWLWVCAPLWIPVAIVGVFFGLVGVVGVLVGTFVLARRGFLDGFHRARRSRP